MISKFAFKEKKTNWKGSKMQKEAQFVHRILPIEFRISVFSTSATPRNKQFPD